jgi:hypothetical protein
MDSTTPIRHPLCREAITHFGVSPAIVAHPLNPAATRWIWPDKKTPAVSLATLCEVVLTAAYAMKTGRTAELQAYLEAKGLKVQDVATTVKATAALGPEAHEAARGAA